MNRLPYFILILAAVLLVAADKKDEKAKKSAPSGAQIQEWAAAQIQKLIKQLGDDDFKVREEATRELINAGEIAFDAVTKATESKNPEVKQRALMIIKQIVKQLSNDDIDWDHRNFRTVMPDVLPIHQNHSGLPAQLESQRILAGRQQSALNSQSEFVRLLHRTH